MMMCYIIKFGDEKSMNEMEALELKTFKDAIEWIECNFESDEDYFKMNITSKFTEIAYNLFAVRVWADDEIGIEVNEGDCDDVEEIIEGSLMVVSEIVSKIELCD